MGFHWSSSPGRLRRLAEELTEELPTVADVVIDRPQVMEELAYGLRPPVHEGRVATYGAIVDPMADPEVWTASTGLAVQVQMARSLSDAVTRTFADGMTSWMLRSGDDTELVVFDRNVVSERDLVVVAESSGGVVIQRHPNGTIRLAGSFGVARSTAGRWQHQPPIAWWAESVSACRSDEELAVLERLLRFAVHDLGSRRIGALLIHQAATPDPARVETPFISPPPLDIRQPSSLAPLHHVLSQLDGAAVFSSTGVLTGLGVRLVPSRASEEAVGTFGGTRHTNARRFSWDEPSAVVIAVSEDGPVTVFRGGEVLGRSAPSSEPEGP